tara:strand:+ start:173 stop:313 length:141 start_codon:yes stop_codon:yes gene_type:complete
LLDPGGGQSCLFGEDLAVLDLEFNTDPRNKKKDWQKKFLLPVLSCI